MNKIKTTLSHERKRNRNASKRIYIAHLMLKANALIFTNVRCPTRGFILNSKTLKPIFKVALCTTEGKVENLKCLYILCLVNILYYFNKPNLWHENENKQMDTDAFDL